MHVRGLLAGLALALVPFSAQAAAAPPASTSVFFPQTGHSLSLGFKHFFDTHGGLDIFGYPTTEEIKENGWTVQYFQRARFEYHPEFAGTRYEVELGLLGDLTAGQTFDKATAQPGAHFFPETGHNLSGPFQQFFDTRGGLDVFGYPTSEPFQRDGFTVQYFQRARMELHGTQVMLGLVGDEYLAQRAAAAAASTAAGSSAPAANLASPAQLTPPASLALLMAAPMNASPTLRVAVYGAGGPSTPATAHVTGNGAFNAVDTSGRQLLAVPSGQTVTVTWTGSAYTLALGSQSATSSLPVRFVPAGATIMTVADLPSYARDFDGLLEADYSTKSNKLWIVNELGIEDYVKGIGEESEGLPPEVYKALAVAYRTYAYVTQQIHHTNPSAWGEPFDLGSSTEWVAPYTGANQIYSGEHRETIGPLLTQGEQATVGQIVTYNGAPAVTPYFSHSDGHTRSWADVWHGNDHPWLISVPDPDSNGESLLGHGVGMPMQSAIKRAAAGWTYDQILRYFYTGVRVTKWW